MPPKKGAKRKAPTTVAGNDPNGDARLTPPDRLTWPGWVEVESEPAFFNVMLKDMGVCGVRIQEIFDLDPDELAHLPQPVHAFIFCFRYKDTEMTQEETACPPDVWFANQIPEFACASVALLNIVNNIKGLQMGKEMRDFKLATQDMDPLARGDAIDHFDHLKRIHNSFARETDMLVADMHLLNKINKAKKRQAARQANATKAAKKAAATNGDEPSVPAAKTSTRAQRATTKNARVSEVPDSEASSPLSDPPESDVDFEYPAAKRHKATSSSSPSGSAPRRSTRQRKPRKDRTKLFSEAEIAEDSEGFHFVAYAPVNGKVWKMDGLDSHPHFVGDFDVADGGLWTNVAGPDIQARMMMFEGIIQYNLMAVVHDYIVEPRARLAANVRELRIVEEKLDVVCEPWRMTADAEDAAPGVLRGDCAAEELLDADVEAARPSAAVERQVGAEEEPSVEELLRLRRQCVEAQAPLRKAVRSELEGSRQDDEKVRLTRHDLGPFVRGWMSALAEAEVLKELVDAQF